MSRKVLIVLAMSIVALALAVTGCGNSQEGKTPIENRTGQPIAQPTTAVVIQGGQKAEGNTSADKTAKSGQSPSPETDSSGRKIFSITDSANWYRAYNEYCGTNSYAELAFWYGIAQRTPATISAEEYKKLTPEKMSGQKYCPTGQDEALKGAIIVRDLCAAEPNAFGGWCTKANSILKSQPDRLPGLK